MLLLNFLLLMYFGNTCLSQDERPEVNTPLGRVQGVWRTSLDGRNYAAFEGIPYAKPPEGELRFEEPQPATHWSGVWIANNTFTCLQLGMFSPDIRGQEDCLYINVYVPAELLSSSKNLEVVVVIHGGGFMVGDAHTQTRSDFFMDKDIVLVTINYRVGLFGFLSTEDDAIPGNNGLKDQALALRWVKDNVASFGGNPHSVTIAGISAGGASVHFHYFSSLSKGLFAKGISQSGTALAPWAIKESPLENARKLAVLVGCPDNYTEDLKTCLKEKPGLNLIKQTPHFFGYDKMPFSPFAPVVENNSKKPFLDKQPFLLLKEGKVLDVPWITSHTADDGLLPTAIYWTKLEEIDENWDKISPYLLDCNYTIPESKRVKVSRQILDYYLGPREKINKENFKMFTQIFTDRFFGVPGEVAAKMQAKVSPVYYYFFNYRKGENKGVHFFSSSPELEGVTHGEDSIYFQGFLARKPFSPNDKHLKDAFHNMLYTFATTGKPSFDGTDNWRPTRPTELTYLNVTEPGDMKLHNVTNLTPSAFWNELGLLENQNLIFTKEEL